MPTKRVIACLDVAEGKVVKGVQFNDHKVVGGIADLARFYSCRGVDELVLYDITASPDRRSVDLAWVTQVAESINIPFCVAGGIRSVEDASKVFASGADKVSINSPAIENPSLVEELAGKFGSQAVVVGVDSVKSKNGEAQILKFAGRPELAEVRMQSTNEWVSRVQELGAGEIVLNTVDSDGTKAGYDLEQLVSVGSVCNVPLVASGGAGEVSHFEDVFGLDCVDAALAASVFHNGQIDIGELKTSLLDSEIEVRNV